MMGWKASSKPEHDGRHDHDSAWDLAAPGARLDELTREELIEAMRRTSSVWEVDWEGSARVVGNEHPTQKPVELFARPMRKHTAPGDLCLEPFSGSGSQLIAAEQTGRVLAAVELEPKFVDVAVRRWQTFTGKTATLEGDGRTWDQVRDARAKRRGKDAPCPPRRNTRAPKPAARTSPTANTALSTPPSKPAKTPRKRGGRPRRRRAPGATGPAGASSG